MSIVFPTPIRCASLRVPDKLTVFKDRPESLANLVANIPPPARDLKILERRAWSAHFMPSVFVPIQDRMDLSLQTRIARGRFLPRVLSGQFESLEGVPNYKGRIFHPDFIAWEHFQASHKPTISIDLDGTLAYYDHETQKYILRPGIADQLQALTDAGQRLVLWTCADKIRVISLFKTYPHLARFFDMALARHNFTFFKLSSSDASLYNFSQEFEQVLQAYPEARPEAVRAAYRPTLEYGFKDVGLFGHKMIITDFDYHYGDGTIPKTPLRDPYDYFAVDKFDLVDAGKLFYNLMGKQVPEARAKALADSLRAALLDEFAFNSESLSLARSALLRLRQ